MRLREVLLEHYSSKNNGILTIEIEDYVEELIEFFLNLVLYP